VGIIRGAKLMWSEPHSVKLTEKDYHQDFKNNYDQINQKKYKFFCHVGLLS
jgi:hypothetical protein